MRATTYAEPQKAFTLFYLRVKSAPDTFVNFGAARPDASFATAKAPNGIDDVVVPAAPALQQWQTHEVVLTRGATTTMEVRQEGKSLDAPVAIEPIPDGTKHVAFGILSGGSVGERRVELDDFLVELLE